MTGMDLLYQVSDLIQQMPEYTMNCVKENAIEIASLGIIFAGIAYTGMKKSYKRNFKP